MLALREGIVGTERLKITTEKFRGICLFPFALQLPVIPCLNGTLSISDLSALNKIVLQAPDFFETEN